MDCYSNPPYPKVVETEEKRRKTYTFWVHRDHFMEAAEAVKPAGKRRKRTGGKGRKLSKAEREARKAVRRSSTASAEPKDVPLEGSLVATIKDLLHDGKIDSAEATVNDCAAPGAAMREIICAMASDASGFRAGGAAHLCRRFAARYPEGSAVLGSVVPELISNHSFEAAVVTLPCLITMHL